MKLYKRNDTALTAEYKFAPGHAEGQESTAKNQIPKDLEQLGELAIEMLYDKNLEVSKVRPFFWSLVEAYVDRFQLYPFDVSKMLFSHLELNDYPKDQIEKLVAQLESQYEKVHGIPLRESTGLLEQQDKMDDELKPLRDSLKYAAMVGEVE